MQPTSSKEDKGSLGRDPSDGRKRGVSHVSSSSSVVSNGDHGDAPEVVGGGQEELEGRSGLPNIKGSQRKGGNAGGGGGGGQESEDDGRDDGMVLPPIGGLRGKRDSKVAKLPPAQTTFKAAANATLQQKPMPLHASMTIHGPLVGMHGAVASGQTQGTLVATSSMSSTDAMSSTNPHGWAATKEPNETAFDSGAGRMPAEKMMNSTWAPNQNQSRRYVSPSGAKLALGKRR